MRWTRTLRLLIALVVVGLPHAFAAEAVDRIAAVINDDAITVRELDERVRMAMALSQLKDSVEVRKRVVPQVLRKMIDEHLTLQEAKRYKLNVTAKEVDDQIHLIEKQNNLPEGTLITELGKFGVPAAALRQQFLADLTWQRLTLGIFQSSVKVSDEEVTERLELIANRLGKPEYMVGDIMLLVDSPAQEDQTKSLGERLLEQLKEGAPFPVLASQFSQAPSANNGGNLGWISDGGMDDDQFSVIQTLTPGTVSKLVRSSDGYHILALISRRVAGTGIAGSDAILTFSKMILPIPTKDSPPKNVLLSKADVLVRGLKSCEEFEAKGRKEGATGIERTGPIKLSSMPQAEQAQFLNIPQGETAIPVEVPQGIKVLMMCAREDISAPLPPRENVRRQIEDERIDMLSRRYMRDIRRSSFIDTRL